MVRLIDVQRAVLYAATALAILTPPARADFVQPTGSPYAAGDDPYNVYAGELSGDGLSDLAAVNGSSSNVTVLHQDAGGAFSAIGPVGLGSGAGPNIAAIADFNADGRNDLAVSNFQGGGTNQYAVTILLRQADNTFSIEGYLQTGPSSRATGVETGDFNGDGRPDLAVSMWDASKIAIFVRRATNDGFDALPGSPFSVTGTHPYDVAVGDLDGANGPDLAIVMVDSNQVTALLSQPGGGYAQPAGMPITVGAHPQHIVLAQLDGDALPDIAVTNTASDSVTVLHRITAGGFTPAAGSPFTVGDAPIGLASADFNGDGRADLAAAASGSDQIDVLRNDGAGGFTRLTPKPTAPATTPYGLATAELNGDGKPDLAFSAIGTDSVGVLDNTSGGPPVPQANPRLVGVARVDHDLTCLDGDWGEAPDPRTITWERNGVPIDGATEDRYGLTDADLGASVRCRVTATNTEGTTSVASDAVTVEANLPPTIISLEVLQTYLHSATLRMRVDNQSTATTWWFTYGLAGTGLTQSTPAKPLGNPTVSVDELLRGATYEIQLHAKNKIGQSDGPVVTFTLPAGLPDDRIYALSTAGQLIVMNADGTNQRRVALNGLSSANISAINGAVSPDGTKVALVSHPCRRRAALRPEPADLGAPGPPHDEGCEATLRVDAATLDGKQSWQLLGPDDAPAHVNPAWSPSGSMLAMVVRGYLSRTAWDAGMYVSLIPPARFGPVKVKRPTDVIEFDAVGWGPSGATVSVTNNRLQEGHYFTTAPYDVSTYGYQFSGGMDEIVQFPSGCERPGNCARKAQFRPEPADLGAPLTDLAVGIAYAGAPLTEGCSYCRNDVYLKRYSFDAFRPFITQAPGVPAAFSPQGDELLLSDGTAVDPRTGAITRRLQGAERIRRVLAWRSCGDACPVAVVPRVWEVATLPTAIAGAGAQTTTITARRITHFGATSIVSDVAGFRVSSVRPRLRATTGPAPCANRTLPAGESCTITVTFDGRTPGRVSARVFPNADDDPTASYVVTGVGRGPTPKVRRLTVRPTRIQTTTKRLTVGYALTGAGKVHFALVRRGADAPPPFAVLTTRRSQRAGRVVLTVNRRLAAGRYVLRASAFTDRYKAPTRSTVVRVR